MDCSLAYLTSGTAYAVGNNGIVPNKESLIRQKYILSSYLDENCKFLLFYSDYKRCEFLNFIRDEKLIDTCFIEKLESKSHIFRPTLPYLNITKNYKEYTHILFMGRTLNGKGSHVAAQVFRFLDKKYGFKVKLSWVGPIHDNESLPKHVNIYPLMKREEYLKFLLDVDIFFSPTETESYGMALIEAARSGLALVTSEGKGMEHIKEIFTNRRNAFFCSSQGNIYVRSKNFIKVLCQLIDTPGLIKEICINNLKLFNGGILDIQYRNSFLQKKYEIMFRNKIHMNNKQLNYLYNDPNKMYKKYTISADKFLRYKIKFARKVHKSIIIKNPC